MKILGIACSPRAGRTTTRALQECLEGAAGVDGRLTTELVDLGDKTIGPCVACGHCRQALACALEDDFQEIIPIMADRAVKGMVIATPVYLGTMTAQCKCLLDRTVLFRRNDWRFRGRVGGVLAVGAARNGGQEMAIQSVQAALLCQEMIVVGDGRPTGHFGATLVNDGSDSIASDEFGIATARNLGRRVAEVTLKLAAGTK